jgi:transposase
MAGVYSGVSAGHVLRRCHGKGLSGRLGADHDAMQVRLTLRYSNGQTEGQVNRLKLAKRQGYGRAKVDLLCKRVLAVS